MLLLHFCRCPSSWIHLISLNVWCLLPNWAVSTECLLFADAKPMTNPAFCFGITAFRPALWNNQIIHREDDFPRLSGPKITNGHGAPFCPQTVFVTFVWIWEQTAIISLYSINWLAFRRVRKIAAGGIIQRTRFVWWISKAINTHSEYVIQIAFRRQPWLRERATIRALPIF